MFEFIKVLAFCAVAWILWLAIPIAAMLLGVALTLWVLYFGTKVAAEDLDQEEDDESLPSTRDRSTE